MPRSRQPFIIIILACVTLLSVPAVVTKLIINSLAWQLPSSDLYRNMFIGATLSGLVSSAIVLALVQKSMVERIIRLTKSFTSRLPGAERFKSLPVEGDDELAEMTRSINNMLESLKHAEEIRHHQSEEISRLNRDLARQARELATANQELESFNYSVSHDMRSPLTRISGYTQLLMESPNTCEETKQHLKKILEAATWLNEMLDSLLVLSRVVRAEMVNTEVDLSSMAASAFSEAEFEAARKFDIFIQPGLKTFGDPALLRIMLSNLASNAIKYCASADNPHIEIYEADTERGTAFCIKDNGIGFEQKDAERIFLPFTRLQNGSSIKGSGIGLTTVQRIVQRHCGQTWAVSRPGGGASFYFTLNQPPPAECPLFP